jgi:UPF0716 family protein affecting phage T7 exclusion
MIGYDGWRPMNWFERAWCFVGGLLLIDPGPVTDLIGITMLCWAFFYQWQRKKRDTAQSVLECAR